MCVVSSVGDDWSRRLPDMFPKQPWEYPVPSTYPPLTHPSPQVTRQEFDELKKAVDEMRKDLIAAKKQDEEEGNPDCEMEEKVALLKKIAELVGVDLSEVWPEG